MWRAKRLTIFSYYSRSFCLLAAGDELWGRARSCGLPTPVWEWPTRRGESLDSQPPECLFSRNGESRTRRNKSLQKVNVAQRANLQTRTSLLCRPRGFTLPSVDGERAHSTCTLVAMTDNSLLQRSSPSTPTVQLRGEMWRSAAFWSDRSGFYCFLGFHLSSDVLALELETTRSSKTSGSQTTGCDCDFGSLHGFTSTFQCSPLLASPALLSCCCLLQLSVGEKSGNAQVNMYLFI